MQRTLGPKISTVTSQLSMRRLSHHTSSSLLVSHVNPSPVPRKFTEKGKFGLETSCRHLL